MLYKATKFPLIEAIIMKNSKKEATDGLPIVDIQSDIEVQFWMDLKSHIVHESRLIGQ